jgi:fructokinase
LILLLGEVLFDVFPRRKRLGGAPFNCAYHLYRLGLPLRFVSRVGTDAEGRAMLDTLRARGFPCQDIQRDSQKPTGKVMVTIDAQGTPSYAILPEVAYDDLEITPAIEAFMQDGCRLVCFGSLVQRTPHGHATLQTLLRRRPQGVKALYDVNLRPDGYNRTILEDSLRQADIVKLNAEELAILARLFIPDQAPEDRLAGLAEHFQIATMALTLGAQGSTLLAGGEAYHAAPPEGLRVRDTVGAGDAFTAMLAAGAVADWPPQKTLDLANRLAAMICGIEGAIPDDAAFYAEIAARAMQEIRHG